MIGLYNSTQEKGKLTSHLSSFLQNKDALNSELDEIKNKIEKNVNTYSEFNNKFNTLYDEMSLIKEGLKSTVNAEDLNELVNDIRNSFEMFLNNTPRHNQIEQEIKALQGRVEDLDKRMSALFNNGEVEVISVENTIPQKEMKSKSKVPKLDITRKK